MTPERAQRILADHGIDASLDQAATVASLARHALRVGASAATTSAPARPAPERAATERAAAHRPVLSPAPAR